MTLLTYVTKGKALIKPEGLRCGAPRETDPDRRCNKLLAKKSEHGQIAGNFRCERCGQTVELEMRSPSSELQQ